MTFGISAGTAIGLGGLGLGAGGLGISAFNAANPPSAPEFDLDAALSLFNQLSQLAPSFNQIALTNPQSTLGALAGADLALQLGRSPRQIGAGPTVTFFDPQTGESSSIRLPGAVSGKERKAFDAKTKQLQADVLEGRMSAIGAISELQQDFPIATAEKQEEFEQAELSALISEIDRNASDAEQRALQRANVGGFSPTGELGDIDEAVLFAKSQAVVDARARADQALGSDIGLANAALSSLEQSLNKPLALAQGFAAQETQGNISLGALAAQQADSIRNAGAQNFGNILNAVFGIGAANQQAAAANSLNQANTLSGLGGNLSDLGTLGLLLGALGGGGGGGGGAAGLPDLGFLGAGGVQTGPGASPFGANFNDTLLRTLGANAPAFNVE